MARRGKDKVVQGKSTCENCYQKRLESIQKIAYLPVNENWKNENKMVFQKSRRISLETRK